MFQKCTIIRSYRFIIPVTLFLLSILGCRQTNKLPDEMVAQVNDRYLVNEEVKYGTPQGLEKKVILALKKDIITRWVESEALNQAALEEGFKHGPKEEFMIREYAKELLVQRYLNSKLNKDYSISRKDIEEYYQKNRQGFIRQQDEMHLIHLFLEHRDNVIFKEINTTDDLLALIKKYYFDEKSTKEQPNGDLGYVPNSVLPDNFIRMLKKMKTGAVSKPIKTAQGYHFLQLLNSKKKGSIRNLELVKSQIIIRLKRERRAAEKDRLLKAAKSNVQIQTYLSKIQE